VADANLTCTTTSDAPLQKKRKNIALGEHLNKSHMLSQACNLTAGKISKLLRNTEDETSEVERLAVGRRVTELGLRRMNHCLSEYHKEVCSHCSV
jgi:hypothetical protein